MRTAPTQLRCEAMVYDGSDRCRRRATRFREGRQVCGMHMLPYVKPHYIDDGFDRIGVYAATMARALVDQGIITADAAA